MTSNETVARRTFLVLVVIGLSLVAMVVQPFAYALLVAAILAGALSPVYRLLAARLGGRVNLAAALVTVALLVVVLIPLAFLATVAVRQAIDAYAYVRQTLESEGAAGLTAHLPGFLREWGTRLTESLPEGDELARALTGPGGKAVLVVGTVVVSGAQAVLQTVLMLVALFFLLTDGRRLIAWVDQMVPLKAGQLVEILSEFRRVAGTLLISMLVTAGVQATAALGGYLVTRVPHPFFFALITFFTAFVPGFGAAGTVVVLAGTLVVRGHPVAGLILALWGVLAVGLIDNVVRPLLIKSGVEIHGGLVFFALLGGLAFFGPAGLIIGPLTLAFALTLARIYRRDFAGATD